MIAKPSGSPPSKLVVKEDIVKGKGRRREEGRQRDDAVRGGGLLDRRAVRCVLGHRRPIGPFPLGAGAVIQGWDKGIPGMRMGAGASWSIPPELAYGTQGQGPIGPNETLIFVVDLVSVG